MFNNAAERSLRAIAVGRGNWTFTGSDAGGERVAASYTLVETAKLNDIDRAPGSLTSSPVCQTIPPSGYRNSCPGAGGTQPSRLGRVIGRVRGLHRTRMVDRIALWQLERGERPSGLPHPAQMPAGTPRAIILRTVSSHATGQAPAAKARAPAMDG